jgi:hypothetical protein
MIELALSMVVIAPILYGTIQYGVGYFIFNDLANAVRSGARYASLRPMSGGDIEGFKLAVMNRTAEGIPAGLRPEHVSVEIGFERNAPATVRVRVVAAPNKLAASAIPAGQPDVTFPYLGAWMPAEPGSKR